MDTFDCDVIVIGTGIGGMTCASAIANKGYKVLVLEADERLGGYCRSFVRDGFRFNAAVHRIGGAFIGRVFDLLMKELSCPGDIKWIEFDEFLQIGNTRIDGQNGNYIELLKKEFPHEQESIDAFFNDMKALFESMAQLEQNRGNISKLNLTALKLYARFVNKSADELLGDYFKDIGLRGFIMGLMELTPGMFALTVPWQLYLMKTGKSIAPEGGMEVIIGKMEQAILQSGGEILLNTPVSQIIIKENRVAGVVAQGKKYYSKYVVSNADIRATYRNLVGSEYIPENLMNKVLNKWQPNLSAFSVWLGLDCKIESLGWKGENVSYYTNACNIISAKKGPMQKGGSFSKELPLSVCSSGSLDATATMDGHSQVMIGVLAAYDFENHWGTDLGGTRSREYYGCKRNIAERFVKAAEDIIPGLSKHIQVMEAATPLTYERFSGNGGGSYQGYFANSAYIMDRSRQGGRAVIPGLYFASSWVTIGGGVTNIMLEAMKTADLMLGDENRDDLYLFEQKYEDIIYKK